MADLFLRHLLRSLRQKMGPPDEAELSDAELVGRFVSARSAAAFEMLVWRHAAMVLAVCRRVLGHGQDAEDAFQAAFLVLVCKGGSISKHQAVGSWLYQVAYRTALRARRAATRRRIHELRAPRPPAIEATSESVSADLRAILDREVARLPERYRAAVVLCYLEGRTKEEAARLLGCPTGTVSSRLVRARRRLRSRLVRGGVTLSAASVSTLLAPEVGQALPVAGFVPSTVRLGLALASGADWRTAGASPSALALAKVVAQQMVFARLAVISAVVLVVALVGGSSAALVVQASRTPREELIAAEFAVPAIAGAPRESEPGPARDTGRFANAPGYVWAVAPQDQKNTKLTNQHDVLGDIHHDRDGSLLVEISHPPRYSKAGWPYYRPVAFDAAGRRCLLHFASGRLGKERAVNRYRLDPNQLPADMVRYVGVEMLPPEGRKLAAASAARQAQENGIQRLPLAEMGQPYEFAVRSMDGQLFRSAELRGSVVVIHCWDDGNASSLTQREVLRTLYERRHAEGLAVLGAHLNGQSSKPETLEPTIRPPWPEMQVPNDPFARGLWVQASEILALPRMLILDRQGILRADSPPDWQDSIDRLLGKR